MDEGIGAREGNGGLVKIEWLVGVLKDLGFYTSPFLKMQSIASKLVEILVIIDCLYSLVHLFMYVSNQDGLTQESLKSATGANTDH